MICLRYGNVEIKKIDRKTKPKESDMGGHNMDYTINFTWDSEANVWIATSNDIPGLVLESGSFDALLERTRFAVPELLELNASEPQPFSLTFKSERHERMIYNG